jgi:dolichol kinase
MSLADGLAAIVGTKLGAGNQYFVFGHRKSVAGTATFAAISVLIFVGYFAVVPFAFTWWFVPVVAAATVLENVAVEGLDNLLVPLLVAVCLNVAR